MFVQGWVMHGAMRPVKERVLDKNKHENIPRDHSERRERGVSRDSPKPLAQWPDDEDDHERRAEEMID